MDAFTAVTYGIIANFAFNFLHESELARGASDKLRETLFSDRGVERILRDLLWKRLCPHTDLASKVRIYRKAKNRIHSLLDLAEAFGEALDHQEVSSLRDVVNKALGDLREDEKAYGEIIREFQMAMLWELLQRSENPEELRKREKKEILENYSKKLETRCQVPDLLGVTGASSAGVYVEDIFVTPSFSKHFSPRESSYTGLENMDDEEIKEFLWNYGTQKSIKAEELFAHPSMKTLLILGLPGSGKTTLLKHQSIRYLKSFQNPSSCGPQIYLPVFIQIRDFAEYNGHLHPRLSKYLYDQTGEPLSDDFLRLYLEGGNIALFYDGLDEIADISKRSGMASDIANFARDYPECQHVVTCRIAAYQEITVDMSLFARFTINDMDKEQQNEFIGKWYISRMAVWPGEDPEELADRLIHVIQDNPNIQPLAANPLMLSIMAVIYGDLRSLPHTPSKLYEKCIEVLMFRRDKAKGNKDIESVETMMPQPESILGELAYGFHKESEKQNLALSEPSWAELLEKVADIIIHGRNVRDNAARAAIRNREASEFCRFIEERTSIIIDRGMGRHGFIHPTFQEYFAAYYLSTWELMEIWSEVKDKIRKPFWREVLLLLFEMLTHRKYQGKYAIDELLDNIMEQEGAEVESSHLLLLADIIIRGTPVTDHFKYSILKPLYRKCLATDKTSGDYVDRLIMLGRDLELRKETYSLLKEDISGKSDQFRHWAIQHFSVRDDLIRDQYIKSFEKAIEPYIVDSHVCRNLLPLISDLKSLAASILNSVRMEFLAVPWYMPPVLPLYYRYLVESTFFRYSNSVLEGMSAGLFICSANLAFLTLAQFQIQNLERFVYRERALNQARDLALTLALDSPRSRAEALGVARDLDRSQMLDRKLALALIRDLALIIKSNSREDRTDFMARDQAFAIKLALGRIRDIDLELAQTNAREAIDKEPFFHAAMIHVTILLEINAKELQYPRMPDHLKYSLKKGLGMKDQYVRAAMLFRQFIKGQINREEKLEFKELLIKKRDRDAQKIFDLAYLTNSETREPVFRFQSKRSLV